MTRRLANLFWGSPRRATSTTVAFVAALFWFTSVVPAVAEVSRFVLIGSPIAVLIGAFPNQTKQVAGHMLGRLAGASHRLELEAIRLDLEGTLSSAAARLGATWPAGVAAELRIDYIRSGEDVERLPDGSIVVGVVSHGNRTRNLVAAAWGWARHAVLPDARPFLDRDVSDGLDFVVARSLLHEVGGDASSEFLRTIWSPAVSGKARLREVTNRLQRLQEDQLLGPVVLAEFADLVVRIGARFPSDDLFTEVAGFVDYLYELAIRPAGKDIGDLANYPGNMIRCRVLMVARPEVYSVKGPGPYRAAIDWAIRRAYYSIYLLSAGRHQAYTDEVLAPIRSDKRIASIDEFRSKKLTNTGREIEQTVTRLRIDVRNRVGIGQRPLVAVGPAPVADLQETREGRKARATGR